MGRESDLYHCQLCSFLRKISHSDSNRHQQHLSLFYYLLCFNIVLVEWVKDNPQWSIIHSGIVQLFFIMGWSGLSHVKLWPHDKNQIIKPHQGELTAESVGGLPCTHRTGVTSRWFNTFGQYYSGWESLMHWYLRKPKYRITPLTFW